jgi:transcriptional regulator with XRE-family HTH domain
MNVAEINWDTLAGRLIEARTRRGLTRRQLCARAGYSSETTLRQYETGTVIQPREDIMARFSAALGCDPFWLMYGRGEPHWDAEWK